MYIPNIPGVSTSVVDKTSIAPVVNHNRTILLPIFSKYGEEGFMLSVGTKQFEYKHGSMDLKKYGIAYLYGLAAATSNRVLTYRLVADDATYSNAYWTKTGKIDSKENVITKDMIFLDSKLDNSGKTIISDNIDIMFSALAKNRGNGYDSLFVKFTEAKDYEKADANKEGETNYKFNFLKAQVYENTPTGGVLEIGNPVVFSLMDVNPITNEPITDKTNNEDLYVNNVFRTKNDFVSLMINDNSTSGIQASLREKANIDIVTNYARVIIPEFGQDPKKFYEIKMESKTVMLPDVNGVNRPTIQTSLSKVVTNIERPHDYVNVIKYVETGGTTPSTSYYEIAILEDGSIGLSDVTSKSVAIIKAFNGVTNVPTFLTIDGDDAFYDLKIGLNPSTATIPTLLTPTIHSFDRHTLYTNLLSKNLQLYKGTDGENVSPNGELNISGANTSTKQSAGQLLVDFFNKTADLREVLYPKYDFDYIPDWTENTAVQQSIISLADDIGVTMPLVSCPHYYNTKITTKNLPDYDLEVRKDHLYQSSYNSMLYSGQMNKTHLTPKGSRIYMPFSYYAMCAHLRVDNNYSITEPVANIEKGIFETDSLNLTYAPTSLEIEALRNVRINTAIVEPDGTYIIDQLTMYKKESKLSRANIVKVLHRIRKDLPKVLKSLIQQKETKDIKDTAVRRSESELSKWKVTTENYADGIFSEVSVKGSYDDSTYKLRLTVTVKPIGTIESIDIPIIVV